MKINKELLGVAAIAALLSAWSAWFGYEIGFKHGAYALFQFFRGGQ